MVDSVFQEMEHQLQLRRNHPGCNAGCKWGLSNVIKDKALVIFFMITLVVQLTKTLKAFGG